MLILRPNLRGRPRPRQRKLRKGNRKGKCCYPVAIRARFEPSWLNWFNKLLIELFFRDVGAGGSNPLSPTNFPANISVEVRQRPGRAFGAAEGRSERSEDENRPKACFCQSSLSDQFPCQRLRPLACARGVRRSKRFPGPSIRCRYGLFAPQTAPHFYAICGQ